MKIPLFLAMTAAELAFCQKKPAHIAWLACHLSPSGTGIVNVPAVLPANSLLILDDSTPFHGHDPQQIFEQLTKVIARQQCRGLILDFQRPATGQTKDLAALLQMQLPCPVAATPAYSNGRNPVLLPPVPLQKAPKEYLAPYRKQEIWLEAAPDSIQLRISETGCHPEGAPCISPGNFPHHSRALQCHYQISCDSGEVVFRLQRTREDFTQLSEEVAHLGVSQLIGLWQEWEG